MRDRRPAAIRPGAPRRIIALAVVLLSILATGDACADDQKHVLILQALQSDIPVTHIIDGSIREEMQSQMPGRLQIYSEFLDSLRFPELKRDESVAAFLHEKYAAHPVDLLIAVGPEALTYLLRRRASLFPDTPIVFAGIRQDNELLHGLPRGVTGLTSDLNPAPTVDLALQLQPEARRLAVVTGAGEFDRFWEQRARQTLRPYEGRLEISYLSGLPMSELLGRLGALTPDTIVLYLSITRDGAGRDLPKNVAKELSDAATAPVYALYDVYFGRGIVGGYMNTFESVGRETGRLATRILSGEKPESIPPYGAGTSANYVDWRQLQRWGLDKSRLPTGTVLRFKEPSLWQRRKWQIVGIFALFIAQSVLITALLVQGRRRLRAEREALESEERMNLATTSANLGLWHWDVVSKRLWTSEICRKIVGLAPKADVTLQKFLGLIGREDLAVPQQSAGEPATTGKLDREHQLDGWNGSNQWIRTVGRTKYDASGLPVWMTGVVIDVTQEKMAERELAHWRQELMHTTRVATFGALSGAMAHELNQPLTAILGNANAAHIYLARKDYDIEEMREIVAEIETEATRAGDIIRHLRALFAKAETQFQPVGANQIIGEVLKLVHSDLVARNINVTFRPAPDLPSVQGDRVQLQQVLLNLIFNACDAMANIEPGKRDLTLMTAPESTGAVLISVSDQGAGVKADMLDRLFRPFVTTKARGLGLGLSICRSIVESHGGQLWATNNPKGGATFCLALPANGATAQ